MPYAGAEFLSAAEEAELARRRDAGDRSARNRLVECNLSLARHHASQFLRRARSLDFNDLFQAGCWGLVRAADRFDPGKGRYTTIATPWVRMAITKAILEEDPLVRIPPDLYYLRMRLSNPSPTRPAGLPADRVTPKRAKNLAFCEPASGPWLSLSCADAEQIEVEAEAEERPTDPEDLIDLTLAQLFRPLNSRERRVIHLRFGLGGQEPRTLLVIGEELGVTRERVRQIQGAAIDKIRKVAQA